MSTQHTSTLLRHRSEGSHNSLRDVRDHLLATTSVSLFRTGKELIAWAILAFQHVEVAGLPKVDHIGAGR